MLKQAFQIIVCFFAFSTLATANAGMASKQPRAWVSPRGNDWFGCGSELSPCKTIQFVLDNTVIAGGTVLVASAGSYPPFVIRGSISIISEGGSPAQILATKGIAIEVQAGATDDIFIKGLTVEGAGTGTTGIQWGASRSFTLQNMLVENFTYAGVLLQPNTAGETTFSLSDSVVRNNVYGVFFRPSSTFSSATADRIRVLNNSQGGILIQGEKDKTLFLANDISVVNNGSFGILAGAPTYLSRSFITGNHGDGITIGSGVQVFSYGNNVISKKTTDVAGTLTPTPLQ